LSGWKVGTEKFQQTNELFITIWRRLQDEGDENNDGKISTDEWVCIMYEYVQVEYRYICPITSLMSAKRGRATLVYFCHDRDRLGRSHDTGITVLYLSVSKEKIGK
jgi:hypothetical protein